MSSFVKFLYLQGFARVPFFLWQTYENYHGFITALSLGKSFVFPLYFLKISLLYRCFVFYFFLCSFFVHCKNIGSSFLQFSFVVPLLNLKIFRCLSVVYLQNITCVSPVKNEIFLCVSFAYFFFISSSWDKKIIKISPVYRQHKLKISPLFHR